MFNVYLTLTLLMAVTASALPSGSKSKSKSKCTSTTYDANYDDLTFNPLLPAANTITTYKGLTYNAFAGAMAVSGQGGTLPHSGSNEIVTGIEQTLLDGTAYIETPSGSTFDFDSFYFGCSLNAATSTITSATSCVLTITGYDSKGIEKADQEFTFTPTGITSNSKEAKPFHASCHSGFTGLQKVQFTVSPSATNALDLDDLVYTIHKC